MPTLVAMQQAQQQILQFLMNADELAKDPTPTTDLVIYDPVHGVTPAKNTDDIFATGRLPVSMTQEPMVFITRSEVGATLKK